MTPHFEFRTIAELLEDNYNRNEKEFLFDGLTQYDGKNDYIVTEEIVYDIIEHLEKYARSHRNKHKTKKSSKWQECIVSDALVGLEKILQEYVKQIEKLQTQLLKYSGTTAGTVVSTKENEIPEDIIEKSSIGESTGWTGLAGGAVGGAGGGAGGGLAAGLKSMEKVGGFESKGEEKELGPGTTGGATGGALGSAGISTTGALSSSKGIPTNGRKIIDLEDTTETTYDTRRDRFNLEN